MTPDELYRLEHLEWLVLKLNENHTSLKGKVDKLKIEITKLKYIN